MKNKDTSRAEIMRHHIEACKDNKQPVVAYCKEHQLVHSNFYYWQKRLNSAAAKPRFTQFSPLSTDAGAVSIHFPNGVRIEFLGSVSPSSL